MSIYRVSAGKRPHQLTCLVAADDKGCALGLARDAFPADAHYLDCTDGAGWEDRLEAEIVWPCDTYP